MGSLLNTCHADLRAIYRHRICTGTDTAPNRTRTAPPCPDAWVSVLVLVTHGVIDPPLYGPRGI